MYIKMKRYICLALAVCLSFSAFSQTQTQARKWFVEGEYAKAKPVFAKLLKSNPKSGSLNYWYGVCLNETGEHDKALPYLKKAVDSEVENAFRYVGDYYLRDGLYEEADPTDSMFVVYTRRAERAKHEFKFYKRVAKVTFVDSIVVEKTNFLSAYRLGDECGDIDVTRNMLGGNTSVEGTAYRTEMSDKTGVCNCLCVTRCSIIGVNRLCWVVFPRVIITIPSLCRMALLSILQIIILGDWVDMTCM